LFEALEVYIRSAFVDDFNYLGRTFRVTAQADAPYRLSTGDALRIRVRSEDGNMVPLGSTATVREIAGLSRVPRYNLFQDIVYAKPRRPARAAGASDRTRDERNGNQGSHLHQLDAAYDASLRDLKRNWRPISPLILIAVGLTTVAVAVTTRWFLPDLPWGSSTGAGRVARAARLVQTPL